MKKLGIGKAFGGVSRGIGIGNGFGGGIAKTLVTGAQGVMNNAISGLINGAFDGHMRDFEETMIGRSALAGYASGMAGTFVSSGLSAINMSETKITEMTDLQKDRMGSFNSTMGNIASMATEFGMTGKTTINVLNFGNLARRFNWDWFKYAEKNEDGEWGRGDSWASQGMLELHIGQHTSNNYFQLGGAGFDFSLGTIARSFGGLSDWYDSLHERSDFAAEESFSMPGVEVDLRSEEERNKKRNENSKKIGQRIEEKMSQKSISAYEQQGLVGEEYFNGYQEAIDNTFSNLLGSDGTEGELDNLLDYLENNGGTDEQIAAVEQFKAQLLRLENSGINVDQPLADKLLPFFQKTLTNLKDNGLDADDSLILITNVMRGHVDELNVDEGGNGLARVFAYNHLADGKGDESYGYAINDVALLMSDDKYVEMVYDNKAGGYSRLLFESGVDEVIYGDNVTYDSTSDNEDDYDDPHFDCGAFVDYVYYAAGITEGSMFVGADGQRKDANGMPIYNTAEQNYNQNPYIDENGNVLSFENYYNWKGLEAITENVTYINWQGEEKNIPKYGLLKNYFHNSFSPSADPRVGDIVFLLKDSNSAPGSGYHVGIYGINDAGQNILIHSAPAANKEGTNYNSGARTNYFVDLFRRNDNNDSYINWLIDEGYTSTFSEYWSDTFLRHNGLFDFFGFN